MAEQTNIQWCDSTFNPWTGCAKVSAGCENCYAETLSKRSLPAIGKWGVNGTRVVTSDAYWKQPLKWNARAMRDKQTHRVFCASLADVFEDRADLLEPRKRLLQLTQDTPFLDWLFLTKRPENIRSFLWKALDDEFAREEIGEPHPLSLGAFVDFYQNVWLGTTVEDQKAADERIPILRNCSTLVYWLSCEPLISPIHFQSLSDIDWVIVGGESGHGARVMKQEWAEEVIAQCDAAGVPVFFKQTGEKLARQLGLADKKGGDFEELPVTLQRREWPRVGGPF